MTVYYCIGGPLDGKYRPFQEGNELIIPKPLKLDMNTSPDFHKPPMAIWPDVDIYRLKTFTHIASLQTETFLVHHKVTRMEALDTLQSRFPNGVPS